MYNLKILGKTDKGVKIGGHAVLWGGRDLDGEYFDQDTDFMTKSFPMKLVFIDHSTESFFFNKDGTPVLMEGVDDPVGEVLVISPDDTGLYIEAMLDRASQYWDIVEAMLDSKKTGLSTGTVGHLARRDGAHITRWPLAEVSLTMTPAEPRTVTSVTRLKTILDHQPGWSKAQKIEFLKTARTAVGEDSGGHQKKTDGLTLVTIEQSEEDIMNDKKKTGQAAGDNDVQVTTTTMWDGEAEVQALQGQVKSLGDQLTQVLDIMKGSPVLKDMGYVAPDSEEDHPDTKTFGDFLVAIQNKNYRRLKAVYEVKNMSEGLGAAGGALVPEEYLTRVFQVAGVTSIIRPRASVIPVSSPVGKVPSLDQGSVTNQGTGETAFAGGVVAYWASEQSTLTSTDAAFNMIEWRVNKIGGYTQLSNELAADAGQALEALLTILFGRAVGSIEDYSFLRGDGVGKPLGILNSPVAVAQAPATDNQFALADAVNMLAKFLQVSGSPVWIMHRSIIPDFQAYFQAGTAGMDFIQPREGLSGSLLGYPIVYSEHLPQANNSGAVILADLSAYIIFDLSGLAIDFSEHAAFKTDEGVWRFTKRLDGQPWMEAAIELADPQGSYLTSPFIYHND